MKTSDIASCITGNELAMAMKTTHKKRKFLAEGFLYEKTINMIAADPGVGKSTISVQVAVELAAGLPVFGVYAVPRPMKVLYIQTERSILELMERLDSLQKRFPIVTENIFITDEYQGFNLLNTEHQKLFVECVMRDCPDADIIFIDPIYCMVAGGLKDDIPASAFTKAMSVLQKSTNAVLWYNHHTVKAQYNIKGDAIEKADPFYGSQWIKAHVTGSFHMKKHAKGVKLILKKDNYNILPELIELEYDEETGICSVEFEDMPAMDKVKAFINSRRIDKKEFSFNDMQKATKVGTRRLRELVVHSSISPLLNVVSSNKNKHLYAATHAQN